MASHQVHVFLNGRMENRQLPQIQTTPTQPGQQCLTAQQYSIECVFRSNSAANAAIKLVREFNAEKGTSAQPKGLMTDRKEDLWNLLMLVFHDLEMLLNQEFKCQKVYAIQPK